MNTEAATLTTAEHRRRSLAEQSEGLLKEEWLHGCLWSLSLSTDEGVAVAITSARRPYRVTWQTSGDRMVKGEWVATDFERHRSFGKAESLFKFLREF